MDGITQDPATVDLGAADPEFVDRIPIAYARQFGVLGLRASNGCLPVAVSLDMSHHALDKIGVMLGVSTRAVRCRAWLRNRNPSRMPGWASPPST